MKRIEASMIAFTALACAAESAQAQTRFSFATGLDYSSGAYGGTMDTEITSVPLQMRVYGGNWSARASVPYLSVTGPADIGDITDGGGDGGAEPGGSGATFVRVGTETGIGDLALSVTRSFRHIGGSDTYFDATARVRLPTGDEDKGLGVGATDYNLGGELGVSKDGGGAYVGAVRRFLGDSDTSDRVDGWQASAGGWIKTGERTSIGAFGYWREASVEGNEDPAEAGAYVSYRMNDTLRVALSASAGLSEASPDFSTGLRFTWRTSGDT